MQSSNCIHGVPDISLKPYSDFTDSMLLARHITTHYRRRKIRLHLTRPRNCSLSTRWEWSWSTTASSLERIRPLVSSSTWFRSNHPLVYILWNYRNIAGEVWSSSFKGSYASGSVCSHFSRHLFVVYQELWGEDQGLWAPAEEVGQPKVKPLYTFPSRLYTWQRITGWVTTLPSRNWKNWRPVRRIKRRNGKRQRMSYKPRDCASVFDFNFLVS